MAERHETSNDLAPEKVRTPGPVPSLCEEIRYQVAGISAEQVILPEEIERWKEGAVKYKEFMASLTQEEFTAIVRKNSTGKHLEPGALQAVFLGEKPAEFETYPPTVRKKLQEAGLCVTEHYVYNAAAVGKVVDEYKKEFEKFDTHDVVKFMEEFSELKIDECHVQRGLLLGFPLSAAKAFEEERNFTRLKEVLDAFRILIHERADLRHLEREYEPTEADPNRPYKLITDHLGTFKRELDVEDDEISELTRQATFMLNGKIYGTQGIAWADYGDAPESRLKQERLERAFEMSGIMEM